MGIFRENGGGGYLNGVTGVIAGLSIQDPKQWPGKNGKKPYATVSVKLDILQEGATQTVPAFLPAGFFYPDSQRITSDRLGFETENDRPVVARDSEFGHFVSSLLDAEGAAPVVAALEKNGGLNFGPLVGLRVTFAKVVDKEATEQFGKRKGKTKDGKEGEFNRDHLTISKVLETGVKVKAGAAAPAPKASKSKETTPAAASTVSNDDVDGFIRQALADAPNNTLKLNDLGIAVFKLANSANKSKDEKNEARKTAMDASYLKGLEDRGVVAFDVKAGTVSAL